MATFLPSATFSLKVQPMDAPSCIHEFEDGIESEVPDDQQFCLAAARRHPLLTEV